MSKVFRGPEATMQAWPAATTSGLPIKITDWRDDVETPAELSSCEVVFITVSTSRDLIEVTTGANGLFTGERAPGPRVVVDCSTVSPEASATVRESAKQAGWQTLCPAPLGNLHRRHPALSQVDTQACRKSYGRPASGDAYSAVVNAAFRARDHTWEYVLWDNSLP